MKSPQKTGRKWIVVVVIALCIMAAYFLVFRKLLGIESTAGFELYVLGGFVLMAVGTILVSLFTLLKTAFSSNRIVWTKRLGGQMIFLLIVIAMLAVLVLGSQWAAHTPPILSGDGKPLPNSIATMEKVKLGGVNQWLIIRGQDVDKPVLLFLSGGPGASEAARVLRFNSELEKHFVVVIWEQRGCGKSYPSINPKSEPDNWPIHIRSDRTERNVT